MFCASKAQDLLLPNMSALNQTLRMFPLVEEASFAGYNEHSNEALCSLPKSVTALYFYDYFGVGSVNFQSELLLRFTKLDYLCIDFDVPNIAAVCNSLRLLHFVSWRGTLTNSTVFE